MKVLVLNGSPKRYGNTAGLIDLILVAAQEASGGGIEVEYVMLNELTYKGCQACLSCKQGDATMCRQRDELAPVISRMADADAWILGTPIYMGQITGQLKMCLDRTYGFNAPDRSSRLPAGKKAVVAVTQGNPNPLGFQHVTTWLCSSLGRLGMETESVVGTRSTSVPDGPFAPEAEEKARSIGAWLVSK
jgi:multimeric flavodoxin WrbA